MNRRHTFRKHVAPFIVKSCIRIAAVGLVLAVSLFALEPSSFNNIVLAAPPTQTSPCADAQKNPLPLPHTVAPNGGTAYEQQIFQFLDSYTYKSLKWCSDKGVRDTGPFITSVYHGTHPAVRIFYSPEVIEWLMNDREGDIPDGAMIIKEQYAPPAAKYEGMTDADLEKAWAGVKDWTIMIRDSAGTKDGWYWGEFYTGMAFDADAFPYNYPTAGFGEYCVRCHASAVNELTFADLGNIKGFPGAGLIFRTDNSWRSTPVAMPTADYDIGHRSPPPLPTPYPPLPAAPNVPPYAPSLNVPLDTVKRLPSETYDRVTMNAKLVDHFVSSDQCMSCHGAQTGQNGTIMWLGANDPKVGVNVSPYGEWRWSPMGLAGRDPIFYAQLESELDILKKEFNPSQATEDALVNLCLTCHGVMGKRQFDQDEGKTTDGFKIDWTQLTDRSDPNFHYGALARDGISCAVCHHITPGQEVANQPSIATFLKTQITGQFELNAPNEINGPFEKVTEIPMQNALGITPKFDPYIKSSRLCGSCHTINLPNVDKPLKDGKPESILDEIETNPAFKGFTHSLEQVTYMEWLNSAYQDEFKPGPLAKSCQDCHMPGSYENEAKGINVPQIQTQIAVVEDDTFPQAPNTHPPDQLHVEYRTEGFARHELLGLNAFLLEMFKQFNDILGVRKSDYMSGSPNGLDNTIANIVQQASTRTAQIEIQNVNLTGQTLSADVKVTNLTGHKFPSGVAFRRAFLEFAVIESLNGRDRIVWASGRTNANGVIVDGNGTPLPTEFFAEVEDASGSKAPSYQPHHQKITDQTQAQIYEELTQDAEGQFTTSFIHRDREIKDNRLLPKGFTKQGPSPDIPAKFIEETYPRADALTDPQYMDGSGTDVTTYQFQLPQGMDPKNLTLRAVLYWQATPPYFLAQRFENIPDGPTGEARRRLYAIVSNLDTSGTAIENMKLKVVETIVRVSQ